MNLNLKNEERKYFGLDPIENSWDKVIVPPGKYDENNLILYFKGNKIVKEVVSTNNFYFENELDIETENRQLLIPRTKKGKKRKLSQANLSNNYTGKGMYFSAGENGINIANFTTQTTFYSTSREEIIINNCTDFDKWKKLFIKSSSEQHLIEITDFKNSSRKHMKYKKGDFFSFKLTRREYGFGRILENIYLKNKKSTTTPDTSYLKGLMGKNLLVALYAYTSDQNIVDIDQLNKSKLLPSEFLMDNQFYFGENKIFANEEIKNDDVDYPISLHCTEQSISFMWGDINFSESDHNLNHLTIIKIENITKLKDDSIGDHYTFKRTYTNFDQSLKHSTLLKILECDDTNIFYDLEQEGVHLDLRNPKFEDIKKEIFKYIGLNPNINYHKNLKRFSAE